MTSSYSQTREQVFKTVNYVLARILYPTKLPVKHEERILSLTHNDSKKKKKGASVNQEGESVQQIKWDPEDEKINTGKGIKKF